MKKAYIAAFTAVFLAAVAFFTPVGAIMHIIWLDSVELTEFRVEGNTLLMNNEINSQTPGQLERIFQENPQIDTIFMGTVPGSLNDDANLEAAAMVAERGITTRINRYSFIASGGTDFFLAGRHRIIEKGAQVGVHSWGGITDSATDFPRGHEYHQPYIDYYQQIGWSKQDSEDFYYYTIEAAAPEDVHIMTEQELYHHSVTTTYIRQPETIYPELEQMRKQHGAPYISEEYANQHNIKIKNPNDPDFPYTDIWIDSQW